MWDCILQVNLGLEGPGEVLYMGFCRWGVFFYGWNVRQFQQLTVVLFCRCNEVRKVQVEFGRSFSADGGEVQVLQVD